VAAVIFSCNHFEITTVIPHTSFLMKPKKKKKINLVKIRIYLGARFLFQFSGAEV
jgi:hypothetical protein